MFVFRVGVRKHSSLRATRRIGIQYRLNNSNQITHIKQYWDRYSAMMKWMSTTEQRICIHHMASQLAWIYVHCPKVGADQDSSRVSVAFACTFIRSQFACVCGCIAVQKLVWWNLCVNKIIFTHVLVDAYRVGVWRGTRSMSGCKVGGASFCSHNHRMRRW